MGVLLIISSILVYNKIIRVDDEELSIIARDIGDFYVGLYRGDYYEDLIDIENITPEMRDRLKKEYKDLQARDSARLNVEEFFIAYEEEQDDVFVKRAGNSTIYKFDAIGKHDERIYYIDDVPYINYKDIDKEYIGQDSIYYKDIEMKLYSIPYEYMTYERIKNSVDYRYNYVDSKMVDNKVELLYKADAFGNKLKITLYQKNGVFFDYTIKQEEV